MRNLYKLSKLPKSKDFTMIGEDVSIDGLNLVNRNTQFSSVLTYVNSDKYADDVNKNKGISCLIVDRDLYKYYVEKINRKITYLLVDNPEEYFYRIHNFLYSEVDFYEKFDFQPKIGKNCQISPTAVIENGVIIGDNVKIGHNSIVRKRTIIEDGVYIGCNTTIGSEGFQIINIADKRTNVKHVGGTILKTNSYIGDNTDICNSLFEGYTEVGENSRIDNLVHVAHNCIIKNNAILTAGVILCGSSIIEDNAWIGTNSTILNNVIIGKNTKIGIGSVVTKSIDSDKVAYGVPAKVSEKYKNINGEK